MLFEYRNFMANTLNNIKTTVNSKLAITSTFLNDKKIKSLIGIEDYEIVILLIHELNVVVESEDEDNFNEAFHKIKCLELKKNHINKVSILHKEKSEH